MHNVHIIVTSALDGEDACSQADAYLVGWGDDNNWYTICGAISEDGEKFHNDSGGWSEWIEEGAEHINKQLAEEIERQGDTNSYLASSFRKVAEKLILHNELDNSPFAWYDAATFCKNIYETISIGKDGKSFDLFEDQFRPWNFDEVGVTHFLLSEDTQLHGKKWAVVIDMHS